MAGTRTKLIALAVLVAVGGAAAYVFTTTGDDAVVEVASSDNKPVVEAANSDTDPVVEVAASDSVIRIEAAGVEYSGWPEMTVLVNGEQIALLNIDQTMRQMYTVDVPATVGAISTVEVKMASEETDCKKVFWHSAKACSDRTISVRGLFLNDEKIEGAVATGEKNHPWSLQSTDGGIKWEIAG